MVINNKLSNLNEHATILLFLYNYRKSIDFYWLYIMWSPLPENIKKRLIYFYSIDKYLKSSIPYEIIVIEYKNIISETIKDMANKTFIKFLYDLNYLDKESLILFTKQSKNIKNKGIVFDINSYYIIDIEDYIKIHKIKENDNSFYNYISVNIDNKINKSCSYYITELIKIEEEWWLIRTSYLDKNSEDEEKTEKCINWIFSEYI
jgi:hypothetical protein